MNAYPQTLTAEVAERLRRESNSSSKSKKLYSWNTLCDITFSMPEALKSNIHGNILGIAEVSLQPWRALNMDALFPTWTKGLRYVLTNETD